MLKLHCRICEGGCDDQSVADGMKDPNKGRRQDETPAGREKLEESEKMLNVNIT